MAWLTDLRFLDGLDLVVRGLFEVFQIFGIQRCGRGRDARAPLEHLQLA
jgi:hypothetical protein